MASDSFWKIKDVPRISANISSYKFNQKIEIINLNEEVDQTSEFALFNDSPNCDLSNKVQELELSEDKTLIVVWFLESR